MGWFQIIKRSPLIHLWLLAGFLISGVLINIAQCLILLTWPFSRSLYRRLISKVSYLYLAELTFVGEWWADIDITFYGKAEDYAKIGSESAILMPNHRSDIDWLIGYILAERKGILGTAKCWMKNDLKFIPTIGWTWWFLEFCFLKRNYEQDKETIDKSLKGLSEYPIPYLIGIFAEGTRMTPAKLKASQEFAMSRGIQPLKHHLLPRPKGFAVTVQGLKDSVPAVYDIEVVFANKETANLKTLVKGGRIETHLHLRRIEMKDVPAKSADETSEWCKELFKEKDALLDEYFKHGKFPGDVVHYPKHYWNLVIVIIWQCVISIPILYGIRHLVASSSYTVFGGLFIVLLLGFILIKLLFSHADTKRGSSFGLKAGPPSNVVNGPKKND